MKTRDSDSAPYAAVDFYTLRNGSVPDSNCLLTRKNTKYSFYYVNIFLYRKEQLLNNLLKWMVALGAIAYVPSLFACISAKLYLLAAVDRLSRRVRAISAANYLLLQNPSKPQVDLRELLRLIADPISVKVAGNRAVFISPEKMTEVVIGCSDLFEILRDVTPLYVTIEKTITIKSNGKLPRPDVLSTRIEGSLVPQNWIDGTSINDCSDEIIIRNL